MLNEEIAAAPDPFTLNMNQAMSEEEKKSDQRILDFFQTDSHEYPDFPNFGEFPGSAQSYWISRYSQSQTLVDINMWNKVWCQVFSDAQQGFVK